MMVIANIPSEMEVALRYKLLTLLNTVFAVNTIHRVE